MEDLYQTLKVMSNFRKGRKKGESVGYRIKEEISKREKKGKKVEKLGRGKKNSFYSIIITHWKKMP